MESFAQLVREMRRRRGRSQEALASQARVSARHLSYLENGRAKPSRDMVYQLANALDVPPRERNRLLIAAGLAPEYTEHRWSDEEMREARVALALILRGHAPFPGVCFDRTGRLVMANDGFVTLARFLGALPSEARPYAPLPEPQPNLVRFLLEAPTARVFIRNHREVVAAVVARARRELVRREDRALRAELEAWVRGNAPLDSAEARAPTRLLLPVELSLGGESARFITTVASLGATFDITLDELRIELYHPADAHSDALARRWLASVGGPLT